MISRIVRFFSLFVKESVKSLADVSWKLTFKLLRTAKRLRGKQHITRVHMDSGR